MQPVVRRCRWASGGKAQEHVPLSQQAADEPSSPTRVPQNRRLVGSRPSSTRPYCSDAVSQENDTWWDAACISRWNRCKGLASKRAYPPLPSNRRFIARTHSVATYATLRPPRRRSSRVGVPWHPEQAQSERHEAPNSAIPHSRLLESDPCQPSSFH